MIATDKEYQYFKKGLQLLLGWIIGGIAAVILVDTTATVRAEQFEAACSKEHGDVIMVADEPICVFAESQKHGKDR